MASIDFFFEINLRMSTCFSSCLVVLVLLINSCCMAHLRFAPGLYHLHHRLQEVPSTADKAVCVIQRQLREVFANGLEKETGGPNGNPKATDPMTFQVPFGGRDKPTAVRMFGNRC